MFYVYVDWTEEDRPRPFYVGKGQSERVLGEARSNLHLDIAKRYGQQRRVHFETESESAALAEETRLMLELKTVNGREGHWGANQVISGGTGHGTVSGSPFRPPARSPCTAALTLPVGTWSTALTPTRCS